MFLWGVYNLYIVYCVGCVKLVMHSKMIWILCLSDRLGYTVLVQCAKKVGGTIRNREREWWSRNSVLRYPIQLLVYPHDFVWEIKINYGILLHVHFNLKNLRSLTSVKSLHSSKYKVPSHTLNQFFRKEYYYLKYVGLW